MRQVLILSPVCIVLPLLSGCWHEAFHTSVENGTGQKVYAVIHFDNDSIPSGHGEIEPGNDVSMVQRVGDISYIDYQIGERRCRMDRKLIAQAAQAGARGVTSITLRDCGNSAP
jgi:hypothetical protein